MLLRNTLYLISGESWDAELSVFQVWPVKSFYENCFAAAERNVPESMSLLKEASLTATKYMN